MATVVMQQTIQTHEWPLSWFAARVSHGREIGVRDALEARGVEHFIPTERRPNYRGKMREHPVIPNLVFLRATKQKACDLRVQDRLPVNYLFDYTRHSMMVVPDKQMDDFRRVFENSIEEGGLMDSPLVLGDWVRVTRGALKDVEGYVVEIQGRSYVAVGLCGCVFVKARVPRAWLAKLGREGDETLYEGGSINS